jgi:hypothetical protein
MNRLTSQQRKLVYLGGIVALIFPIAILGLPPDPDEAASGGLLSKLRQQYELGESTLGDVDPSSATMNLVLLGLRGIAANLLHIQAIEEKENKNWAELRATVDSITLLQPHYIEVWNFQSWNLAYNVSAEWDAVEDRYYWVKEGTKFVKKGAARNRKAPELYYWTGKMLSAKIGQSDEARFFRRFFREDPDPRYKIGDSPGPDSELNPEGKDNYLVAKAWFEQANQAELNREQHIMMRMLFRSYPARAQFDYAQALYKDGIFGSVSRESWGAAFEDWTQRFGQERWESPGGEIQLEATPEVVRELARHNNADAKLIEHWIDRYQKIINYNYWRNRASAESRGEAEEAHRDLFAGREQFKRGEFSQAKASLLSGLEKFEKVFKGFPELREDETALEESLTGVLYLRYTHQLMGVPFPSGFPLQQLWNENQDYVQQLDVQFRRENGL